MSDHPGRKVFDALVWVLLGAIFGWAVSALFEDVTNLLLWLFILTSIAGLATFGVVLRHVPTSGKLSEKNYDLVVKHCEKAQATLEEALNEHTEKTLIMLDEELKQQVQIIPRERIYPVMARVLREAEQTVAVITYFMYDWEAARRTFLPSDQEIPGVEGFYQAIYECIESEEVEYLRVWQVPAEHKAEAFNIIQENPLHKREIELIRAVSRHRPEQARFIICDQHTTASYILVDRKHLFFNIDFYDLEEGVWYSPYMILIKDATENAFVGLNSIIIRLTSRVSDWCT